LRGQRLVAAARALGRIGHASAVPSLLDAMGVGSVPLRQACCQALGSAGDPSVIDKVLAWVADERLASVAVEALASILSRHVHDVDPGALRLLAVLPNPVGRSWRVTTTGEWVYEASVAAPVDASHVRELAGRELTIRGTE